MVVTIASFAVVLISGFWLTDTLSNPDKNQTPKAAIIDQLYPVSPNEDLNFQLTNELERSGFTVDIFRGNDVTVDFYRGLAKKNYTIIIIRSHSGAAKHNSLDIYPTIVTCLFTNTPYTPYNNLKYTKEQLNDEIFPATLENDERCLIAIGPKFITDSMVGNFNNTMIVIDGCSGLHFDDLAQAFIKKGASAYFAWDKQVYLDYVDGATLSLVKNLCSERLSVSAAVKATMTEKGKDPNSNASLQYYPIDNGNRVVEELVGLK